MQPRALVFDFFGVIANEIAPSWLQAHFSAEIARDIKATIVAAADRGLLSDSEMFEELGRRSGISAERIEREWRGLVRVDARVLALVAESRRIHKVALLTNAPREFFRRIEREHGLQGMFDAVLVSSEMRIAKPDAKAFQRAADVLRVPIQSATMIDDNPVNVSAARDAGMVGVLFRSYHDLRAKLEQERT